VKTLSIAIILTIILTGCMSPRQFVNDTRCIYESLEKYCDAEMYEADNGYKWRSNEEYRAMGIYGYSGGGYYSGSDSTVTIEETPEQAYSRQQQTQAEQMQTLEMQRQTWLLQQASQPKTACTYAKCDK